MKITQSHQLLTVAIIGTLSLSGCANMDTTQLDTLIGAGGGAALGAVLGNNVNGISKKEGAVAGALLGGVAGNVHGRQQQQIQGLQGQITASQQRVVTLTNSNGSTTPVVLTQTPQGFQGPRGETYATLPSSAQLRSAYGF